jgi:transposase
LEEKIEALEGDWRYGEIIDLPGWKTIKYKELDHDIIAMAELTTDREGTCNCPPSESELNKSGFTDPYYVNDALIRDKRVRVYYRLQRWFCKRKGCRKGVQQSLAGVDPHHKMTSRLVEYVMQESFDLFRNFSGVADEVGCSEQTVRNIFTRRAKQLEDEAKAQRDAGLYEPPEWLAIDEVYPRKRDEKYTVISAPAFQKVVEILPTRNEELELARWLIRLRSQRGHVKVVTIDMCKEYRRLVSRILPGAQIVVDRYHVHNMFNVALKAVLEVFRALMTDSERREMMRPEKLLLTSYRKLSEDKEVDENGVEHPSPKEQTDRWLGEMPDLARAHQVREDFSDILQLTDRSKAEELTDAWLRLVHDFIQFFRAKYEAAYREERGRSDLAPWPKPFENVPGTIVEWRKYILNYIDCKFMFNSKTVSNSFAEFANGRIKEAYRVGHHYSYAVLRIKCKYGGVMVRRRPPHPLDSPRLRVVRSQTSKIKRRKEVNPNANLEILKRARIEGDDTRELLPRPEDNPEWTRRFNKEVMEKTRQKAVDSTSATQVPIAFPCAEEEEKSSVADYGRKRRINFNPDQGTLF